MLETSDGAKDEGQPGVGHAPSAVWLPAWKRDADA